MAFYVFMPSAAWGGELDLGDQQRALLNQQRTLDETIKESQDSRLRLHADDIPDKLNDIEDAIILNDTLENDR